MTDAFHDDGPPISRLHAAVKALDAFVHSAVPPFSSSSTAAVPPAATATPVQRFARQELCANRWKELAKARVAVCGLGGIGAQAADALVRMGVGRVLLVDGASPLDWSGLGHAGFQPEDVGLRRLQALRLKLQSVHARASVDSLAVDWGSEGDLLELRARLQASSATTALRRRHQQAAATEEDKDMEKEADTAVSTVEEQDEDDRAGLGLFEALTQRRPYDVVLSCVEEDGEAVAALNQICLELSLSLLHAGLAPSSATVQLRTVLPGHSSCLACLDGARSTLDEVAASIARAFPAALPHVELLAGGLLAQHAVKFLLELGDFVPLRAVHVATFEMESFAFPPNSACANATCRQRQQEEASAAARYH